MNKTTTIAIDFETKKLLDDIKFEKANKININASRISYNHIIEELLRQYSR